MNKRQPEPCAQWAERLAQASFGHLSEEEDNTLRAHLTACPACAAARADYLRAAALLRRAPDPDPLPGLPPQLLRLWDTERKRLSARQTHAGHLQETFMSTTHEQPAPSFSPKPPTRRQQVSRRAAATLSAVAAVLVIAAVIAALVASHTTGTPSPTATQPNTSQPATSPVPSNWQALPHLSNLPNWPMLAPSDPRVAYQVIFNDQRTQASLQRSDDQGATWKNLPAPPGVTLPGLASLYISPTNAKHVLLIIGNDCPSGQAAQTAGTGPLIPLSNGKTCSTVYFSSTGGERWARVTLPTHGGSNLFLGGGIFAQENRLYAPGFVEPGLTGSELIVSSDDGATWRFADQGLNAEQHCLQGIAVPRTGSTLFAMMQSHCGGAFSGSESAQIWRSDDAGAHWTAVSSIPATALVLEAINVSGQAQPALLSLGVVPPYDPTTASFSLDNGKTWQPIPTLAGQGSANNNILAVRNDGSIIEQAKNGFYAWKPGQSDWHKVAPALDATVMDSLIVSDANGQEILYVGVRAGPDGNNESFYRVALS